jgi:hypothetical protein
MSSYSKNILIHFLIFFKYRPLQYGTDQYYPEQAGTITEMVLRLSDTVTREVRDVLAGTGRDSQLWCI